MFDPSACVETGLIRLRLTFDSLGQAVDLDVTQALQPEFDRLLDASGLSQADMEQACSDAQDYLIGTPTH